MLIDIHSHFLPPAVLDWLKDNSDEVPAVLEHRVAGKEAFLTVDNKWSFELKRAFYDPELYLREQRDAGLLHTLVSPIPQLFLYDSPATVTRDVSRLYNRELAIWVKENSQKLSALATVPLNEPNTAALVLEEAMNDGLKGVIVGPGHNGLLLGDEQFTPFWEAANARQAVVFVHPLLNTDARIQRQMMPNLIGVPWETTVCALNLILSGTLDKYPHVRVLLAHGGGFLPYQVGRLEKGYEVWPRVSAKLSDTPLTYIQRFWYDSVLWNDQALEFLISLVGEDRVLPGSDYPFDLRSWPPAAMRTAVVEKFLS